MLSRSPVRMRRPRRLADPGDAGGGGGGVNDCWQTLPQNKAPTSDPLAPTGSIPRWITPTIPFFFFSSRIESLCPRFSISPKNQR